MRRIVAPAPNGGRPARKAETRGAFTMADSEKRTAKARRGNVDGVPPRMPRRYRGEAVNRITVRLPDGLVSELDAMATRLTRSRADIVRHAVERYLDDLDDLEAAAARLRDPNDPVLDWDRASRALLDMD